MNESTKTAMSVVVTIGLGGLGLILLLFAEMRGAYGGATVAGWASV